MSEKIELPKTDLQQIKGIGKVLAKRLTDEGLGDFHAIAEAGEEGLQKIRGIQQRAIASILAQAKELAADKKTSKADQLEAIKGKIGAIKEKVTHLAETSKERFNDALEGKCGKKLAGDLVRIVDALDRMDVTALKRLKRVGRGLEKAEKRVEGLEEAGLKKVRKGLKKSRKALLKALA